MSISDIGRLAVTHLYYSTHKHCVLERKSRGGADVDQHSNAWFGPHKEREAYENLLAKFDQSSASDAAPASESSVSEDTLRKALLRRAMTDLRRAWQLQDEHDSVRKLMLSGSISEDMWAEFKEAESAMQIELFDLQAEAETFRAGWGKEIMRDAAGLIRRENELVAMKEAVEQRQREGGSTSAAQASTSVARSRHTASNS